MGFLKSKLLYLTLLMFMVGDVGAFIPIPGTLPKKAFNHDWTIKYKHRRIIGIAELKKNEWPAYKILINSDLEDSGPISILYVGKKIIPIRISAPTIVGIGLIGILVLVGISWLAYGRRAKEE